jgi:hypothetical protein
MRPVVVAVRNELGQESMQMSFVQDDHVGTVSLPNLAAGAHVIAGVNASSFTPGASCEGLSKNVNLGNNYARVTVTYAPRNDARQSGTCVPATGACDFSNVPDGNTCSDDNVCTSGDACVSGSCRAGSPIVCNDGNACTSDTCNPTTGCVFTNNTIGCDDGNPSTVGDACAGGVCQSGTPALPPSEVQNVMAASDKSTFSWSTSAGATRYDGEKASAEWGRSARRVTGRPE